MPQLRQHQSHWGDPAVFQDGWTPQGVLEYDSDNYICGMCAVRLSTPYAHCVRHVTNKRTPWSVPLVSSGPSYEVLYVCASCAQKMCEAYDAAAAEERDCRRIQRQARFLALPWKISRRGDEYLLRHGFRLVVGRNPAQSWFAAINGVLVYGHYATAASAKQGLFDRLDPKRTLL